MSNLGGEFIQSSEVTTTRMMKDLQSVMFRLFWIVLELVVLLCGGFAWRHRAAAA
jgi:hypothetical protein